MAAVDRKTIAKLLALGATQVEVCQELGMSPSHLSQLVGEDSFQELLAEMQQVATIGSDLSEVEMREELYQAMDDLWDEVEELSISKLRDNVKMGLVTKSGELLQLATLANKATRKKGGSLRGSGESSANIIQLNISNILMSKGQVVDTVVNSRNQVIEVAGKTIINENKTRILQRLEELENEKRHSLLNHQTAQLTAEDL